MDHTGRVVNELMSKYMSLALKVEDLDTPGARRPTLSERNDSGNG